MSHKVLNSLCSNNFDFLLKCFSENFFSPSEFETSLVNFREGMCNCQQVYLSISGAEFITISLLLLSMYSAPKSQKPKLSINNNICEKGSSDGVNTLTRSSCYHIFLHCYYGLQPIDFLQFSGLCFKQLCFVPVIFSMQIHAPRKEIVPKCQYNS